ncbi:hypothetical protein KIPE111705_14775 [Kibdelosporangium persicum]|uniref:Uncharacterized protein n=1 Tax=Kibdelosporangium persicum TaxID=2698649 RepID=A0ABX2F7F5_9PSEU|nr:hypothetical protein [Kibdelosporangium persicum]NRN67286.1 hypothetical protein [Kibdelosporangium persicum]
MDPYAPAPDPRGWRRGYLAACVAVPFTLMQIWAMAIVLTTAHFDGPTAIAIPLALSGTMVAVLTGWRWVWRLGRKTTGRRRPALIT